MTTAGRNTHATTTIARYAYPNYHPTIGANALTTQKHASRR
jgi:hypothetical protein